MKYKQFLASREFPPALAASPRFYGSVVAVFEAIAPMVRYLNEALA